MIADFIVEKMAAYILGGATPEAAAELTGGELLALYLNQHWSRDGAGNLRPTMPPENIDPETAMRKADKAIAEILNYCTQGAGKGLHGNAPEDPPVTQGINNLSGFERMAVYAGKPA